jgi:hypothetical protein
LRSNIGPEGQIAQLPVGLGMQEHPLALFWLFHRPGAAPELDARQTNCCLRYSSGLAGASDNDMMVVSVNQTLALPEDGTSALAATDGAPAGTWGGAGGGNAAGGPGLLCVWVNQQHGHGWLRLASPDPTVHPLVQQDLLHDEGDLVPFVTASNVRWSSSGPAPSTRHSNILGSTSRAVASRSCRMTARSTRG